ncbi:hypothetical protein CkaCkLH20_06361 [Colletotrichum karsti]|uniref:BTB domain-containing protein n=1 Tax=Colletotrichum karsti TaxID=1095194 RepID=A0A9P6LK65_9PEZI|nr:uncharacterized protein CkaCkLH20_06361 [Colletotrichum karsti]KAF9876418.1 hypothetical protein CkaCkLH20_06361 [Colletotrichum karsti]
MEEDTVHDPPSPVLGELITFDPNGDLYLHVGAGVEEKTKTYFVCSKALARASTVFRKMLYGGFAESGLSDADHGWTVDLPEDRQEPMELMLNIVHGTFDMVPEKLELTQLYTFLVVTEKYDATNITRPWAKGWMDAVKSSMQNPLLLGVAYELGDYQTFNAMAMRIATECHLDDDGDLVFGFSGENRETYSYKLRNLDCLIPAGLLEDAASIRKTLLIAMLDPYLNLYAALKGGDRSTMSSSNDEGSGPPAPKRQKLLTTKSDAQIIFDEHGDLYLHVGAEHAEHPTTFLVCSRTVSRLSKVMNRLLYGGFAESKRPDDAEKPWEVELPGDEPADFKILLGIMHGKFEEMPKSPDMFEMYRILVAADKYDCVRLLRPWSRSWIQAVEEEEDFGLVLGIAWHLGDAVLFKTTAKYFAEGAEVNGGDELLYDGELNDDGTFPCLSDVLGGSIPSNIFASITDLRQRLLDAALRPYAKLHRSLLDGPKCPFIYGGGGPKVGKTCDNQLLGSLTRGLFREGINIMLDVPQQSYRRSCSELSGVLMGLELEVGDDSEGIVAGRIHAVKCKEGLSSKDITANYDTVGDDPSTAHPNAPATMEAEPARADGRHGPREMSDEPAAKGQRQEATEMKSDVLVFDELGDLRLQVGAALAGVPAATFLVCSRTMARASPVFKKMLYGGFAESKPTDGSDWVVDLPEDHPRQIRHILHIAHVGANKYDCIGMFRPWAKRWLERIGLKDKRLDGHLLFVAWEFGQARVLRHMMAKVADEASLSEDGDGKLTYGFRHYDDVNKKLWTREWDVSEKLQGLIPVSIIGKSRRGLLDIS